MAITLKVDPAALDELRTGLGAIADSDSMTVSFPDVGAFSGSTVASLLRKEGALIPLPEITIVLSSASAFAALYKVICSYLARNNARELIIETRKGKVTLKAHSLADEAKLLSLLGIEDSERGNPKES